MSIQSRHIFSVLVARLVQMNRRAKVTLMVAADLVMLPLCFLIAMILRGGDLKLAMGFGPGSYFLIAALTVIA